LFDSGASPSEVLTSCHVGATTRAASRRDPANSEVEGTAPWTTALQSPVASSRSSKTRRRREPPPGQYVTTEFAVLSAGPTPQTKLVELALRASAWRFAARYTDLSRVRNAPQTTIKTDTHCVTRWSIFDATWQGATFDDQLKPADLAEPPASYIMAHCDGVYSTNLRVADLLGGRGMVVTRYKGPPLFPAHGGPASWRRTKCGFREQLGYHNYRDLWKAEICRRLNRRHRGRLEWQLAEVCKTVAETSRVNTPFDFRE
jgi:DMSO/TMAO reductase YedYZ molybdopterin-dependent catalytic subunit